MPAPAPSAPCPIEPGAKGICNQLPGCAFLPLAKQCLPKALDTRSVGEVQALAKAFGSGDPKLWGACPGACYVRQVRVGVASVEAAGLLASASAPADRPFPPPPGTRAQAIGCQQAYNSSAACAAKPYCVWEFDSFDSRQVCLHRDTAARGSDAFSKQYAAIKVTWRWWWGGALGPRNTHAVRAKRRALTRHREP